MKSKAEYQRRWYEGCMIGYMAKYSDPSFPRRYARAMMREDKRRYWAKKHRVLGPSYNRTIEVMFGKQRRKQLIDRYYNRSPIGMWPTCIIDVDLVNKVVISKHYPCLDNRMLFEELLAEYRRRWYEDCMIGYTAN